MTLPVETGIPASDRGAFRRTLGEYATGVAIITTSVDGVPYGLTSNSFASVSLDPPLVLWSLRRESQSFSAFERCKYFAVNVLSYDQVALSQRFARSGPDKFSELSHMLGCDDVPLLQNVAAILVCRRASAHEGGDHLIVIGEVQAFSRFNRAPLIFSKGQYGIVADHPGITAAATAT